MREILFRGKTKNGEWVEGDFVRIKDGDIVTPYIYYHGEVIEKTVGQFTGLTDKNGKKIFEGDIIKIYWKDNVLTMGDIRYDKNMCRFVIAEDFAYPYGFDNTTPFEVIGNIHDNPELLEVK